MSTNHAVPMAAATLAAVLLACSPPSSGPAVSSEPSVQYLSPAGVEYMSLPDTGAVARADSALAADRENVDRILDLGLAWSGIRGYREAIETFSRGIEIEPDNALLYRWRGHRYLSVRRMDSARADLERCLVLDATVYGCWYHLAIVKYAAGDFTGAADAFAQALPLAPDPAENAGSIDWGWMSLSRAGRTDEATAWLDTNSDSLNVQNAYTQRLQLYRGRIDPAALVTAADTADVQIATLNYGLGNWYLLQGDTVQARDAFERAVASGGWPAFGFIVSEAELRRLAGS